MKIFECLFNLTILTSFCVVMRFCFTEKKTVFKFISSPLFLSPQASLDEKFRRTKNMIDEKHDSSTISCFLIFSENILSNSFSKNLFVPDLISDYSRLFFLQLFSITTYCCFLVSCFLLYFWWQNGLQVVYFLYSSWYPVDNL